MRSIVFTIRATVRKPAGNPIENQDGSIIFIAVMLLLVMTIIGISASKTSITESFIIRNTAIHTQNISLVESAALEIAEDALINVTDWQANACLAETAKLPPDGSRRDYIINDADWGDSALTGSGVSKRDQWYNTGAGGSSRVLDDMDSLPSTFPQYREPALYSEIRTIDDIRGESDAPLRVALVGWNSAPGSSLKGTGPTRKRARVMAEYISPDNGMCRLELGIEREF